MFGLILFLLISIIPAVLNIYLDRFCIKKGFIYNGPEVQPKDDRGINCIPFISIATLIAYIWIIAEETIIKFFKNKKMNSIFKVKNVKYRVNDCVFVIVSDDIFGPAIIESIHIDINLNGEENVLYDIKFIDPCKDIDEFKDTWRVTDNYMYKNEDDFNLVYPTWPANIDYSNVVNLDKVFKDKMRGEHKYPIGTNIYYVRDNRGKQAIIEKFIDEIFFDVENKCIKTVTSYVVKNYEDNKYYQLKDEEIFDKKEDLVKFLFRK